MCLLNLVYSLAGFTWSISAGRSSILREIYHYMVKISRAAHPASVSYPAGKPEMLPDRSG
jgi:hypothetical protein